jgi:hypothetical protein
VRVRAPQDQEHNWYINFTLYRGGTSLPTTRVKVQRNLHPPCICRPSIIPHYWGAIAKRRYEAFTKFHLHARTCYDFRKEGRYRNALYKSHRMMINPRTSLYRQLLTLRLPLSGIDYITLAFVINCPSP